MGEGCTHDVTGICLGYFYMGCSGIGFVYSIYDFARLDFPEGSGLKGLNPALFFALIAFISFLFVMGIQMRHRWFILPWLVFSLFVCGMTLNAAYQVLPVFRLTIFLIIIFLIVVFLVIVAFNSCVLFVKIGREKKRSREAWNRLNLETENKTLV